MKNMLLLWFLLAGLFSQKMAAQIPATPAPVFVRKVKVTMIGHDAKKETGSFVKGAFTVQVILL